MVVNRKWRVYHEQLQATHPGTSRGIHGFVLLVYSPPRRVLRSEAHVAQTHLFWPTGIRIVVQLHPQATPRSYLAATADR